MSPTRPAYDLDPFHNGQTPACRLLLHAIQDVFPELQQQQKDQTPSSHWGQLLRWQFMNNRKARNMLPSAPPLVSESPALQQSDETTDALKAPPPPAASKKKRKRKKKKKQDAGSTDDGDNAKDSQHISATTGLLDRSIDHSVESLDQSVHEHIAKLKQESFTSAPALESLPSDDKLDELYERDPLQSSGTFFAQIQPQPSEDSELSIPPPPLNDNNNNNKGPHTPSAVLKTVTSTSTMTTPTLPIATHGSPVIYSPTHEWVPEEGATSLEETPPGDVIKNPLELPYLLSVNSDNGLTTTTIDGSLISAAESAANETKPSSLETTKVLFEEWLDRLDHEASNDRRKEYQSFINFLQARLQGASQPLGIALHDLKQGCAMIECHSCQQDALAEVEKVREGAGKKSVVLNPACLKEEASPSDASVDQAFDYIALEEGHHHMSAHGKPEEEEEDADLDKCLSFAVSAPKQKKNGAEHLFLESLTQTQLVALMEQWLPCGIEEDIMVTTTVLGKDVDSNDKFSGQEVLEDGEFRTLQETVLANERDLRDSLGGLHSVGEDLLRELSNINSSFDPSLQINNLEFRAFPIMKNCDKMCFNYMAQLLDVLSMVTSEKSSALDELQLHLWTSFLGTLAKTLNACETYYNSMAEEMVDQRGVVPKMFVSAPLRKLFRVLVEEKVLIWTDLGQQFSNHLTNRVLKEWLTRSVWEDQRAKIKPTDESLLLDDKCHDLVKDLLEWTETMLGGRVAEIQRSRMEQTEEMLELLQTIVEPLAKEYATVERYFSSDRNKYFASLRSNVVLAQGVKKRMRLIDNVEVENMATGVILMWRHVRIMQSRMIYEPPPLPLQFKRWMLQDERRFDDWRIGTPSAVAATYHQLYCQPGRAGKRRLMCVLAGLVYRWLEERCMEWKAEIAEKELLGDFDVAEGVGAIIVATNGANSLTNKASKSSKRNKKKKNKGANAAVKEDEPRPPSTTIEDSTKTNGNHEKDTGMEKEELTTPVDAMKAPCASQSENKEAAKVTASSTDGQMPSDMSLEMTAAAPIADEQEQIEEDKLDQQEQDVDGYYSSVFVEDGKQLLSARDFLISRMHDLLTKNADDGDYLVVSVQ